MWHEIGWTIRGRRFVLVISTRPLEDDRGNSGREIGITLCETERGPGEAHFSLDLLLYRWAWWVSFHAIGRELTPPIPCKKCGARAGEQCRPEHPDGAERQEEMSILYRPYVIIRTYSAGVHAGYLKTRNGKEVELERSRRIWWWCGANTLYGISLAGVAAGSRISCEVPVITLTEAIEIIPVSKAAQATIECAEWAGDAYGDEASDGAGSGHAIGRELIPPLPCKKCGARAGEQCRPEHPDGVHGIEVR